MYDACEQTLVDGVSNLLDTISDFVSALVNDVASVSIHIPTPKIDMCGGTPEHRGDCKNFVCHVMMNGLDASQWLRWQNIWGGARRLATQTKVEKISTTEELVIHIKARHNRMLQSLTSSGDPLAGSTSHNEYTSGGFDPFQVACD